MLFCRAETCDNDVPTKHPNKTMTKKLLPLLIAAASAQVFSAEPPRTCFFSESDRPPYTLEIRFHSKKQAELVAGRLRASGSPDVRASGVALLSSHAERESATDDCVYSFSKGALSATKVVGGLSGDR